MELSDPDSSVEVDEVGFESALGNGVEEEEVLVVEEVLVAGGVVAEAGDSAVFVFIGPPTEAIGASLSVIGAMTNGDLRNISTPTFLQF